LGGAGYVGRHLAAHLRASGYQVLVPRRGSGAILRQPLGRVIYAIGLTADFRSRPFETVEAHVNLLSEVLRHGDFESLLYLSSTRVYACADSGAESSRLMVQPGDPSDLYNLSKLMGESLALHCGRDEVRIARLSNIVGGFEPSNSFLGELLADAREGSVVLRSALESEKDYLHVADAAIMLADIATAGRHQIYNVASGVNISHRQWVDALRSHFGCSVHLVPDSPVHIFPPISIQRYCEEFAFRPGSAMRAIEDFKSPL
jgi:nucleoside-diphosphate-sugar epimerase